MTVASLELCKELYELSGWEDTEKVWKYTEPMSTDVKYGVRKDGDKWCYSIQDGPLSSWIPQASAWPAYDLGYLLRKLPFTQVKLRNASNGNHDYYWAIQWRETSRKLKFSIDESRLTRHREYSYVADTPEDAAAKLAIELFKEGVLTDQKGA